MAEKKITPKAPEAAGAGKDPAAARVTKTSMKKVAQKRVGRKKA